MPVVIQIPDVNHAQHLAYELKEEICRDYQTIKDRAIKLNAAKMAIDELTADLKRWSNEEKRLVDEMNELTAKMAANKAIIDQICPGSYDFTKYNI